MDLRLKDAVICISGGTKGLGREAAIAFAQEGAKVAISGRDTEAINTTVRELFEAGAPDAFGLPVNLQDPDSIQCFFAGIDARWGQLNTLVNMAGPNEPSGSVDFSQVPDDRWQYYFDLTIMSAVRCTKAALPLMRKGEWGRIVNISSISARLVNVADAPYMAAKAGLNALTKNMAWALAGEGIIVNTVTPGVFRTEGMRTWMEMACVTDQYDPDDLGDIWRWMRDVNGGRHGGVNGRVGLPDELAPIVLLLGSPKNTYIVGADIPVDGGTDYSSG